MRSVGVMGGQVGSMGVAGGIRGAGSVHGRYCRHQGSRQDLQE